METSAEEATTKSEAPLSQPLSQRGKSEEHVGSSTPSSGQSERSASVPLLNRGEAEVVEFQPESRADPTQQQKFSVQLQPLHTATESGMFSPNITGRFSVRIASDRPSSVEETPRESPSHASAVKHGDHHSIATPSSHLSLPITPSNKHAPSASPSQARTPPLTSAIVSEESSLANTEEFSAASVMSSEPASEPSSESLEVTMVSSASSAASSSSVAPSIVVDVPETSPADSLAATAPPSYFSPRTPSQTYTPTSTSTSSFSPAHASLLSVASTPASLKINAAAACCVICAKGSSNEQQQEQQPLILGAQGLYFHAGCLAPAGIPQTPSTVASDPISPTADTIREVIESKNDDSAVAAHATAASIEVQLLRAELARMKLQQEEQQRDQIEFERTHGTQKQFMRDAATAFATAMTSPRTRKDVEQEEKQQSLEYEQTRTPFHNIAHPYSATAATSSFHSRPALSTETLITPAPSAANPLVPFPHPPCYPVPAHQMPFPVLSELDRAAPAPLPGLTAFNVEFPRNSLTARNVQPLPNIVSPFHKPSATPLTHQQQPTSKHPSFVPPPAWGNSVYQPKCEGDAGRSLLYETAEERREREEEEAGKEYFPPEISQYAQADEWVANYDSSALNIYRGWGTVKKKAPPPAPATAPVVHAPKPPPPPAAPAMQPLYAAASPVVARPPSPKEITYEAPLKRPPPASAPSNGMFWADLHPTLNPDPTTNANYPQSHPLPPMSPLTHIYHQSAKPHAHLQEEYAQTKKRMNHARY